MVNVSRSELHTGGHGCSVNGASGERSPAMNAKTTNAKADRDANFSDQPAIVLPSSLLKKPSSGPAG